MKQDGDTVERKLPVELTRVERHERALELAEKIAEGRALEARRKAAASEFKASDQELRARADELSEAVKSGREPRLVDCRWQRNDTYLRMELARLDTGEIIESRPLTPEERQVTLFSDAKRAKAAGDGEASEGVRRTAKKKTGDGDGN